MSSSVSATTAAGTSARSARRAQTSAGPAGTAIAAASHASGNPPVTRRRPRHRLDGPAERVGELPGAALVAAGDEQPVEARCVEQLAGRPHGDLARAHQEHGAHRKSGPSSSRHPPDLDGTLPLARNRTTAPATTAIAATSSPRRNFFTVGLGGIEPPTSSLSGMRSNRLSYSPGGRSIVPARPISGNRGRPLVAGRRLLFLDGDLDAAEELGEDVVEGRRDHRDHDLQRDDARAPTRTAPRSTSADRKWKSFESSRSPMNFSTLSMMPAESAMVHSATSATTMTTIAVM